MKKVKITYLFGMLLSIFFFNHNQLFGQTAISVNAAGWKKIAYNNLSQGRGFGKVSIYAAGGSFTPQYADIHWFKDWKDSTGIKIESSSNNASYWTEARLTYSADTVFLEVYFNREMAANLMSKVDPYGWNPMKLFSGPLPEGGSQKIGIQAKVKKLNIQDKFTIDFNGNVGIGTNSPQDPLSVNGRIRAREVKVEVANWPDYVFNKGYERLQLKELDEFIKINKHLPEIPTASQVYQEGIEIGEMNKLLLKKIEELTLHLIEKEYQFESLTKKMEILEKQINEVTKNKVSPEVAIPYP